MTDRRIHPQLRVVTWLLGKVTSHQSVEQVATPTPARDAVTRKIRVRGAEHRDVWVERSDGTRLRLAVYLPRRHRVASSTGVLWIHGGGYSSGTPELESPRIRALISEGAVVVSPDYRRSGEAPYPAALDDCYAALLWLRDHAEDLGVRKDQLAVGGGSAGGGLAAALALYARDQGEVQIAFQMPLYPMIDDRGTTEAARLNDIPPWDGVTNESAWRVYLGRLHGTDEVPAYAAPARATNLTGLPPAFTYVGDIETFYDETVTYIEALRGAGVHVEYRVFKGAIHGFDQIAPWTRLGRSANAYFGKQFRSYSARYTAVNG